jgi:hypothetical protein
MGRARYGADLANDPWRAHLAQSITGNELQRVFMALEKTLNAKNLVALGADRLAELLLELAQSDAAMKRQLRLELASQAGSDDIAAEIRKRLATIAKSKSFVDWQKIRVLTRELDAQHAAILKHVAPTKPAEALDLLWRLLDMAPSLYERCDDSNGIIGDIMAKTLSNLGAVARSANLPIDKLADRVFASLCADDYGQFNGLIAQMAEALGKYGLGLLKTKFEALAATPPAKSKTKERRVIGYGLGGPLYEDDFAEQRHARMVRAAMTDIADALGDVDGYAACFAPVEQANPAIAANIAERLLAAGRFDASLAALAKAEGEFEKGGHWPDWERVRIDVLEALGRAEEAQQARWAIFQRDLNADYLRAHLKRLPDFDDEEAESRAIALACAHANFQEALAFLVSWPAHDAAAHLILKRLDELDGDHYWLLTPAADALDQRYPLAATLMLRAMIHFALDKARVKRYRHAANHLKTCTYLAKRIGDWGGQPDHDVFVADLKRQHGRKSAFWNAEK